jgi:hypothetical protein
MPKQDQNRDAQDTSSESSRRILSIVLQTVVLLVVILVYLYLTAQSYVIDCTKDDNAMVNCTLSDTVMGIVTLNERTITGMPAAAVNKLCEGTVCKYRLELYDNQGIAHPVEEEFTANDVVKERLAKMLNQFVITADKQEILLKEQVNWLVFMLPVVAIGAFVLYLLNANRPKKQK